MVVLFDLDSLMYKSCYFNLEETIAKYNLENVSEDELISELAGIGQGRLEKKIQDLLIHIEANNIEIDPSKVELYITTCKNSIRKKIYPQYKANRKKDDMLPKIVGKLQEIYKVTGMAICSDEWEADDLIADRARELGDYGFIIIGMDKDFIQLGGLMFDFYSKPALKDEKGEIIEEYPMRGLKFTEKHEAEYFLAYQMIVGDSSDNIKGVPKLGEKKATEILQGKSGYGLKRAVILTYLNHFGEDAREQLLIHKRLLFLGANI